MIDSPIDNQESIPNSGAVQLNIAGYSNSLRKKKKKKKEKKKNKKKRDFYPHNRTWLTKNDCLAVACMTRDTEALILKLDSLAREQDLVKEQPRTKSLWCLCTYETSPSQLVRIAHLSSSLALSAPSSPELNHSRPSVTSAHASSKSCASALSASDDQPHHSSVQQRNCPYKNWKALPSRICTGLANRMLPG